MSDTVRILCLDGGGAKGFYTLGALREIETLAKAPLHERFRLIYGTSTGSIIAALLALGRSVEEIHHLYSTHVPKIMGPLMPAAKSRALKKLADEVFEDARFDAFKTDVGIVTTNLGTEKPMIFKTSRNQAHGMEDSFVPGFGCTISDAVQGSCSAYPFFKPKKITTSKGDGITLIDGGYCANNPTLYGIAEALIALEVKPENLRVVSLGVGVYPPVKRFVHNYPGAKFFQQTLEINTQSMEQLTDILYSHVPMVRINKTYNQPQMATDLLEKDLTKLNTLRSRGAACVAEHEAKLKEFLA